MSISPKIVPDASTASLSMTNKHKNERSTRRISLANALGSRNTLGRGEEDVSEAAGGSVDSKKAKFRAIVAACASSAHRDVTNKIMDHQKRRKVCAKRFVGAHRSQHTYHQVR